ncbi:DUF3108 domain-containing protein [Undibacterium arcticum]|uniref:DUF3108 domain-containing protein n=1 Tax=Undibacterium arcticum TaxID=1762892 RepID=A0ABV7F4M3_9BURK
MKKLLTRTVSSTASALLAFGLLSAPAWALDHPAPKRPFNLPPSAELSYSIKARQSGLMIGGDATVSWNVADNKYSVVTETRAMILGKILDARSEGAIDQYGLAPVQFTEKRFRKGASSTSFSRSDKLIRFSESSETYPIVGGEQDRTSAIWQLIAVARGAPDKFKVGSDWKFFVAGRRDAEPWSFKVVKQENIQTPLGELAAVHIVKAPPPDSTDQQLDIWLAPSLEWYPVRLRFTDADGDFVEQFLEKISKTAP